MFFSYSDVTSFWFLFSMKKRTGKISLIAAGVSAGVHLAALGGFAMVRPSQPVESAVAIGAVCVEQIREAAPKPLVTEKPVIQSVPKSPEPATFSSASAPIPMPAPASVPVAPPKIESSSPPQAVYEYSSSEMEFFGNRTAAKSVCFVVDCSGSMYGRLGMIQKQLKDCIASLYDTQSFYLIFFMDGETLLENGNGKLAAATGPAKSEAFAMIDRARLGGQTNASHALKRAMQLRDAHGRAVQLIYFLTDGFDLADNPAEPFYNVLMDIRKKNAPKVAICTIGLWTSDADQQRLKLIAEMTGGTFLDIE
jgi:hypothetical protein